MDNMWIYLMGIKKLHTLKNFDKMRFLFFFAYSKSIRSWEYSLQVSKWFLENCRRYSEKDPSVFDTFGRNVIILNSRQSHQSFDAIMSGEDSLYSPGMDDSM